MKSRPRYSTLVSALREARDALEEEIHAAGGDNDPDVILHPILAAHLKLRNRLTALLDRAGDPPPRDLTPKEAHAALGAVGLQLAGEMDGLDVTGLEGAHAKLQAMAFDDEKGGDKSDEE